MTTNVRPKPMTDDVRMRIFDQMEATLGKWERRGYCPCCIARNLLAGAGLVAAYELQQDDMRDVLEYIADLSVKRAPCGDGPVRH